VTEPTAGDPSPEGSAEGDLDEIVSVLRSRVEARQRAGVYPAGLDEEMGALFRRILHRREPRDLPDLEAAVAAIAAALPLQADRIPATSNLPGGTAAHRAIGKVVGRQTQGVLEQVQTFAEPVVAALRDLATAVRELHETVTLDIAQSLDALYGRQSAQARILAATGFTDRSMGTPGFQPWYSSERFEDEFRGAREDLLVRYRDLAERLAGSGPVLDVGCGRGEFLELLGDVGVEASGVDTDAELVKAAVQRGLAVEHDEALRYIRNLPGGSLGGIVTIQVIEHFSPQEIVDFIALAAVKLRPGGKVFIETVNPQSLYVYAHAMFIDPTHVRPVHPAYLAFLLREAGFTRVDIEWRSPPPEFDVLEPVPAGTPGETSHNRNVERLNTLLFAPQDYLIAAVR
jgi:2-polyprenyl-3-methyl-5-hydroxy-6-metoxy-1,4-benzoquinol methylase